MADTGRMQREVSGNAKSAAVEYSLGNETIIQPKRSKIRDMAQQLAFANILIGMVLGAALICSFSRRSGGESEPLGVVE